MSATIALETRPRPADGGTAARRAVVRWAWRLFRHEWRQQLLVLGMILVAVAATFLGGAVAADTPLPANAGFGTALDMATFNGGGPKLATQIAGLHQRFGPTDVIENQTLNIPGTVDSYELRAQDPRGPFGGPLLKLVSGHYPAGPDQVDLTPQLAGDFRVGVGGGWAQGGPVRQVVGLVENPENLADQFALVAPGQVTNPSLVSVLFDAPGIFPPQIGSNVTSPGLVSKNAVFNPRTVVLAVATVCMLLIALVAAGGFTVLAQRRLRAIGMIGALGATDRHIRLVIKANGAVVGVGGALLGFALWAFYRPYLQTSAHHLVGLWQVPWNVVIIAMVLGIVATVLAAWRPARTASRVPIVAALSGRPAPPRQVSRSALPGLVCLVLAFLTVGEAAEKGNQGGGGTGAQFLVLGLVVLIAAVILLAPAALALLARLCRRAPLAIRLAVRDLARYRARSSSALGAISVGILIAVVIAVAAAARYGNVLDYAGPNLASNQLIVYGPDGPKGQPPPRVVSGPGPQGGTEPVQKPGSSGGPVPVNIPTATQAAAAASAIASIVGAKETVALEDTTTGTLLHAAAGRNWNGDIYVATPQLLAAFGINPASIDPRAEVLTSRPGLSGLTQMQLNYASAQGKGGVFGQTSFPCPAATCQADPVIQEVDRLPSGVSAPNTVFTEAAVRRFGLQTEVAGWLIQTTNPLNAAQIRSATYTAAAAGIAVETKNDEPTSSEVIDLSTLFGILLALGVLGLTVGLIRAETASDLRILAATGASSTTRRSLTAATAGALALLGALLGTVSGYVASIAWFSKSVLNDGLSALTSVPVVNLAFIVVGMPLLAMAAAWLLAGREPDAVGHQPLR
jgi:putative ABC transport system permease protein